MDKHYNPIELEKKLYQHWEKAGFFKANKNTHKPAYCIMIPPPNVTGHLHMGHAFQDSLMDALIRYHRMLGENTLWQTGTDHAGIATQMVVERQLIQQEQKTRHDLGREAFVRRIWEWKEYSGNTISGQLRRMGASVDWERERFTMDEGLSEAVRTVFIELFNQDLIYRGKRLVNWDPILQTAVSDLEVIKEEADGFLWHIRYPIQNKPNTFITIATTRPETLLGDVAVAVHPNDTRYAHLIGQNILLPLTDRIIPIIADDFVKPEFGTGAVKITPAHDFNDYDVGKRHNLPVINILTLDVKLNDQTPKKYQGLDRFVAREKIVEDLTALGLLDKIEPYKIELPRGDRSGQIIEPLLTNQWFVKTESLAQPAIKAVQSGKIKFVPENWSKTYFEWMNNIQDWCISRQLWWGHRIPAWYDEAGNIYVGKDEQEIRTKNNLGDNIILNQDPDVLDTWFSSALWPFSTLGWPEKTPELDTYYPTNVLVTGFDIIFFWVARMIMMGLKFTDKVPFHTVYIHGLIQDAEGQKMSKSKGNVLDPLDLIDGTTLTQLLEKRTTGLMQPQLAEKIKKQTQKQFPDGIPAFGTDALRFTFCALATHARHIRFDLKRIEGYKNFCNKLWNAARYVLLNTEDKNLAQLTESDREYSIVDKWILSELEITKQQVHTHFENYRFDLLANVLYDFTWNTFCDWYLELSKPVLNNPTSSDKLQNGTRYTLVSVLESILKLIHPLMPFITEEIWLRIKPVLNLPGETIMLADYPIYDPAKIDSQAQDSIRTVQHIIIALRNIRGETGLPPGKAIQVVLSGNNDKITDIITHHSELIKKLAKVEKLIKPKLNQQSSPIGASAVVDDITVLVPFEGLIDKTLEIARLTKEIDKLDKEILKYKSKLDNASYINNAPKDIVQAEQEKLVQAELALDKYQRLFQDISKLPEATA